jgi:HEPN domain-containing protein
LVLAGVSPNRYLVRQVIGARDDSVWRAAEGLNTVAMPSSVQARRFYRAAKQRFDDALLLLEMERTTAAVYLAGYSVECMLKALILSAVPPAQEAAFLTRFRGARAHDYEWLLELYAEQGGARLPASVVPHFARVNSWSTDMRYTPGTIAAHEAQAFVAAAIAIMTWADGRL